MDKQSEWEAKGSISQQLKAGETESLGGLEQGSGRSRGKDQQADELQNNTLQIKPLEKSSGLKKTKAKMQTVFQTKMPQENYVSIYYKCKTPKKELTSRIWQYLK